MPFLAGVIKDSDKTNLREKGLIWFIVQGYSPSGQGKSGWQMLEAACHTML